MRIRIESSIILSLLRQSFRLTGILLAVGALSCGQSPIVEEKKTTTASTDSSKTGDSTEDTNTNSKGTTSEKILSDMIDEAAGGGTGGGLFLAAEDKVSCGAAVAGVSFQLKADEKAALLKEAKSKLNELCEGGCDKLEPEDSGAKAVKAFSESIEKALAALEKEKREAIVQVTGCAAIKATIKNAPNGDKEKIVEGVARPAMAAIATVLGAQASATVITGAASGIMSVMGVFATKGSIGGLIEKANKSVLKGLNEVIKDPELIKKRVGEVVSGVTEGLGNLSKTIDDFAASDVKGAIDKNVRSLASGLAELTGQSLDADAITGMVDLVNQKAGKAIGEWQGLTADQKNDYLVQQVESQSQAIASNIDAFADKFGYSKEEAKKNLAEGTKLAMDMIKGTASKETISKLTQDITAKATKALEDFKGMTEDELKKAFDETVKKTAEGLKVLNIPGVDVTLVQQTMHQVGLTAQGVMKGFDPTKLGNIDLSTVADAWATGSADVMGGALDGMQGFDKNKFKTQNTAMNAAGKKCQTQADGKKHTKDTCNAVKDAGGTTVICAWTELSAVAKQAVEQAKNQGGGIGLTASASCDLICQAKKKAEEAGVSQGDVTNILNEGTKLLAGGQCMPSKAELEKAMKK